MTQTIDLHVFIPAGLNGVVNVHVHCPEQAEDGRPAIGPRPDCDRTAPEAVNEVAAMLARFEDFTPESRAREIHEAMLGQGWEAFTPKPRGDRAKSEAAYIRYVYRGRVRRASLYLNSLALIAGGSGEKAVFGSLPYAEPHSSDVYVYHSDGRAEEALAATTAVSAWADGE